MSEKMTSISIPGHPGYMVRGKIDRARAIAALRKVAEHEKKQAEIVLSASDDEFVVEHHTGIYARRNVVEVKQ